MLNKQAANYAKLAAHEALKAASQSAAHMSKIPGGSSSSGSPASKSAAAAAAAAAAAGKAAAKAVAKAGGSPAAVALAKKAAAAAAAKAAAAGSKAGSSGSAAGGAKKPGKFDIQKEVSGSFYDTSRVPFLSFVFFQVLRPAAQNQQVGVHSPQEHPGLLDRVSKYCSLY